MRFVGLVRLLAFFLALTATRGAFGAGPARVPPTDRVKVHAVTIEPKKAAPGSTVKLVIDFEVMPGYHTYAPSTPSAYAGKLELKLDKDSPFALEGDMGLPKPKVHIDKEISETGEVFHELEGRFKIEQGIKIPAGAKGKLDFSATLSGQACDDRSCEPVDLPVEASVTVEGAAAAAKPAAEQKPIEGAPKDSLFAFLLTAIGAGLISLLMPCVFPMIPITVSVFTKQAAGNKGGSVKLAAIYGLSIVFVFTAIGVLCSALLGAGGANTIGSNPWVNLVLGALFVVFALSLLGAFELRLPSFLINKAAAAQDKATGVAQVVMMAVVFTLTSFTCTVPFIGGLLVQAAGGSYTWPLLGMLAFSSTFALPFFLLALAPSLVGSLPAAGGWMNSAKIVMGLVEFAFALKFVSNADMVWELEFLTRPAYLAAWVVIGLVTTLYLLGRLKVGYDLNEEPIGPYRVVIALLFGSFTLYLATGFLGNRFGDTLEGLLPGTDYGLTYMSDRASAAGSDKEGKGGANHLAFLSSYSEALAAAKEQKKPLFIDFTGVTCANCRSMEQLVFPLPEVRAQLEQFVRVQLYVDKGPEKAFNKDLQLTRYKASAQPYYVVLDPSNEETLEEYPGYAKTKEMRADFAAKLESAAKKYAARPK